MTHQSRNGIAPVAVLGSNNMVIRRGTKLIQRRVLDATRRPYADSCEKSGKSATLEFSKYGYIDCIEIQRRHS